MSAQPVDVLGRLASMAVRYDEWEAIHDAVAELVEAAKAEHKRAGRPIFGDGMESYDRLTAALARVQGGAA